MNPGDLVASSPAPPPGPRTGPGVSPLVLVAVFLILALAAVALRSRGLRHGDREQCEARLTYMGVSAELYRARYHAWPAATGPEFWDAILNDDTTSPIGKPEFAVCPGTGKRYRGPSAAPTDDNLRVWIACCEPGVHGDEVLAVNAAGRFEAAPAGDARFQATRP